MTSPSRRLISHSPRSEGTAAYRSALVRPSPGFTRIGFTLIEMAIVLAIVAVVLAMASVRFENWQNAEAVMSTARDVEGAFSYARGEAVRTGNDHLLFFQTDISGNPLTDANGNRVPILILDDGRPGSANQNCQIDAGEPVQGVRLERKVNFGATAATAKVPIDTGTSPFAGGFSFSDSGGGAANWVLFRPDGTPRAVDAACAQGPLGSGGGGVYLSNGDRDAAVVLTPLGAPRVFTWEEGTSTWK